MDHPCHKCGHSIEDGRPFCSECGAPQIRVAMPEPEVPSAGADVPADGINAFSLGPQAAPPSLNVPGLSPGIEWPRAFRTCAVVALISVVAISLRLMAPLLAGLGAGCFAVILYHYRNPIWKATARSGAQLGAVTALLSSGMIAIFFAIAFAVLQAGG